MVVLYRMNILIVHIVTSCIVSQYIVVLQWIVLRYRETPRPQQRRVRAAELGRPLWQGLELRRIHIRSDMQLDTRRCVAVHTYTPTNIHTCVCVYIYIYTYICIYIFTHMYMYTYMDIISTLLIISVMQILLLIIMLLSLSLSLYIYIYVHMYIYITCL